MVADTHLGSQSRHQGPGPTTGSLWQLQGLWLSACSPVVAHLSPDSVHCRGSWWQASPWWHAAAQLEWLTRSPCTAVSVSWSCLGWCPAFCSHRGLRWPLVWFRRSGRSGRGGNREAQVSTNMNTHGAKAGEICRAPRWLCWPFFSGKICWVYLQSRSLWTLIAPALCLLLIAPAFLLCS